MKFTKAAIFSLFSFVIVAVAHGGDHPVNETTPTYDNGDKQQNETVIPEPIHHDEGDEAPGSGGEYVVIVDDEDPRSVEDLFEEMGGSRDTIVHKYHNSLFKGFSATMSKHCAGQLKVFGGIKRYEPKMMFQASFIQQDAPWGLSRISKNGAVGTQAGGVLDLGFEYTADDQPGDGVDIYIVDTGVNVKHQDFNGRAKWGFAFDKVEVDGNGHGTHCAGTAASTTLGVAKNANIIAVKVLGADGSGTNADILAGINWVIEEHDKRKRQPGFKGSVISMSLGSTSISETLDAVVAGATTSGIHVSVAAGNAGQDACLSSPGFASSNSSASVISVGAIDINDERAGFSNFGECVTTYAPGVDVISTFIDPLDPVNGRENIINNLSGTSMACPHISGLIAYYVAKFPELASNTKAIKQLIINSSEKVDSLANIRGDPAIVATNKGQSSDIAKKVKKSVVKGFESFGRKRDINNRRLVRA